MKKLSPTLKFKVKTICVGNIYLGGTGKTPLSNLIASKLKKKFKTAVIKKRYSDHMYYICIIFSYIRYIIIRTVMDNVFKYK